MSNTSITSSKRFESQTVL